MKFFSAARTFTVAVVLLTGLAAQGPNFLDRVRGPFRSIELGDIDGDGVPDYLMGDSTYNNNTGRITILDGQTRAPMVGQVLATANLVGMGLGWLFGWSQDLGDLDCDGKLDLLVGCPGANAVMIFWGDGRTTDMITGPQFSEFGHSVSIGGDIDGDGKNDAMIGAPKEDRPPWLDAGAVYVLYGGTLQLTRVIRGGATAELRGWCVNGPEDYDGNPNNGLEILESTFRYGNGAGAITFLAAVTGRNRGGMTGSPGEGLGFFSVSVGDLNGDGRHEVYSGSPFYSGAFPSQGRVGVYSIPFGAPTTLYSFLGKASDEQLGVSGAALAGPATALTLMAGGSLSFFNEGFIRCFSTASLSQVYEHLGAVPGEALGSAVGFADANQDGNEDLAFTGDSLYLMSIGALEFRTDGNDISLSLGGAINYEVVKPQAAGHNVLILGTERGIAPGNYYFGKHFSFNPGAYTFANPNPLFTAQIGSLDYSGGFKTTFMVPALPITGFMGLSLHHLAVTWDPAQGVANSIDPIAPHVARVKF